MISLEILNETNYLKFYYYVCIKYKYTEKSTVIIY